MVVQRNVVYKSSAISKPKKRCVSAKIKSAMEYGSFKNVLADVLINAVDDNRNALMDEEE